MIDHYKIRDLLNKRNRPVIGSNYFPKPTHRYDPTGRFNPIISEFDNYTFSLGDCMIVASVVSAVCFAYLLLS